MALRHPDTLRGDAGAQAGCRDGMKRVVVAAAVAVAGWGLICPSFEVIIHKR